MVLEILLSKIDSDSPIITFSGVLISCDTLARKSVFALLAASAFSFNIFNSWIYFMSGFSNVKYMKIVTKLTPLLKSRTLGINTCRAKELRNNIIDINIDQFLSL